MSSDDDEASSGDEADSSEEEGGESSGSEGASSGSSGEEEAGDEHENDDYCTECNETKHADRMLLCDGCPAAWHIYCLPVPLESVPTEDVWHCPACAATAAAAPGESTQQPSVGWHELLFTCLPESSQDPPYIPPHLPCLLMSLYSTVLESPDLHDPPYY